MLFLNHAIVANSPFNWTDAHVTVGVNLCIIVFYRTQYFDIVLFFKKLIMSYILPKAETIALFDALAPTYDDPALRFAAFAADQLLARLQPKSDQRILDLATGTGHVALAACQMLTTGRVTGIDLSEKMLDKAYEKIQHLKIKNIDLYNMDAENLEFKSQFFHHGVCAYGLPFFNNPIKALQDCRQVICSGGQLLFALWDESAFQPVLGVLQQQLAQRKLTTFMAAAKVGMNPIQIKMLFQKAGFADCPIQTQPLGYHLQRLGDSWDVVYHSHLRIALSALPPAYITDFKLDFLQQMQKLSCDQGLWLDMTSHFVTVTA